MKNKISLLLVLLMVVCLSLIMGCVSKNYLCPNGETVSDLADCNVEEDRVVEGAEDYEGGEEEADVNNNGAVVEPNQEQQEVSVPDSEPQLELTLAQISKLDEMITNKMSVVYPITLGATDAVSFGGTYTYAYAIRNSGAKPLEFRFYIELLESKTESFSNGGADETVLDWFNPHTNFDETYILGKNEIAYVPLVIVVGDKVNEKGDPVFAGTYKFRAYTETIEGPFDRDYHYTDFNLRVVE